LRYFLLSENLLNFDEKYRMEKKRGGNTFKFKILVVEDNLEEFLTLKKIIRKGSFKISHCKTGEEALKLVSKLKPDIVLLDIILPGISGIEVCKKIRESYENQTLPIIYISVIDDADIKLQALEAGGTDYIKKPFEPAEVLARINLHTSIIKMNSQFKKEIGVLKKNQLINKVKLEEKNSAIREMIELIKDEKSKVEKKVTTNIDKILRPILNHIGEGGTIARKNIFTLIEKNINELTSNFGSRISAKHNNLTQKELEICNMLKSGMTSKEIADILAISYRTIEKHRYNIRKKLGLIKKGINLITYLNNLSTV